MDAITDMADIFDGAAEFIEQLLSTQPGALSDADILKLYGFYKQATCGPCTVPKPGMFDFRGKAKWEAWNKLGQMTQDDARLAYITLVGSACEGWEQQLQQSGAGSSGRMGPVFSTLAGAEDDEQEGTSIHDAACKGDVAMLQACIASGEDINSRGEGCCTALHFAADRGHLELVQWLIQHGAQLDAQDEEGQTALHYAAMCEQQQVYKALQAAGADASLVDKEGSTAAEQVPAAWSS